MLALLLLSYCKTRNSGGERWQAFKELAQDGARREAVPHMYGGVRRTLCASNQFFAPEANAAATPVSRPTCGPPKGFQR
jgi:hypothetical protein